jgi:peptide/nickel transport system ATP-binding protein
MVLRVDKLSVTYATRPHTDHLPAALDQVCFELQPGEVLGVAGESGSGKSTLALALMGLLPPGARVTANRLALGTTNLLDQDERGWQQLRGHRMSMVFQEPAAALDPVFRVGRQIDPLFRRLHGLDRRQARQQALAMLESVGFTDPGAIHESYPGTLSGGMKQRVLIAMALVGRPQVLIADEPSSALDVRSQARVLGLLHERIRADGIGLLLISHDLGVIAQYTDRALVMHRGRIVEQASVTELFAAPRSNYTRRLLEAVPRLDS